MLLAGIVGYTDEWDALALRGKLRLLSPEETIHALIIEISEDIEQGSMTVDELQIWRDCLLNTPFEFVALDAESSFWWASLNKREAVGATFDGHFRTPVQRCYEVAAFRARKEAQTGFKPTVLEMVQEWSSNLNVSNMSEKIDKDYIDVCLVIHDRLLSISAVRDTVLECEELFQKRTPFDSIYKLEVIARRAIKRANVLNEDKAIWVARSLKDMVQNGDYTGAELSVRALSGKGQGGRGLVDLILYKLDIHGFLLHEWVEKLGLSQEAKDQLRCTMASHNTYRSKFGFRQEPVDLTWMAHLTPAEKATFRLVEAQLCAVPAPDA